MSRSGLLSTPAAGVYLPADFGQFWRAKRNNAAAALAQVAFLGDSLTTGQYSSNLETKGFYALLRTALQNLYGDGGSGFKGVSDSATYATAASIPAAYSAAMVANGSYIGQSGTWVDNALTFVSDLQLNHTMSSVVAASTLTFTVRGTTVKVFTFRNAGLGTLNWTIDGVAQTAINTAGAQGVQVTTVTGLAPGNHTVVLTQPSTTAVHVIGVTGQNTTGIVCHKYSRSGAKASDVPNAANAGGWAGGAQNPADLAVYMLGVNDANANATGDVWAKSLRTYLADVKETTTGQTDVLLVLAHIGTWEGANVVYQDYAVRARGIAESYGAGLLNLWRLGRNSWQYWNSLGYWGVNDGTGNAGSDGVHLSDVGHAYLASQIQALLTA